MSCRSVGLCEFCQTPGIVRSNGAVICDACRYGVTLSRDDAAHPARTTPEPAREPETEA